MPVVRRIPFPLLALCATTMLLGVTWAIVTPAFQAPDENQHFAYTEYLARTGHLPGDPNKPAFSTEQREAGLASNSDQAAGAPSTKMDWSRADWEAWQRKDAAMPDTLKSDAGGPIPATANPPLYYAYEAIPAKLAQGSGIYTRLTWERIFSSLWAIALVVFAWLLAGEVLGRDRPLQFVAAAVAGLLPMVQFVSASVTPDAMLYAVWAAVFWTGTRLLKRGLTPGGAALFLGAVGAACVVKATSYALLPGALLVLAIGTWRIRDAGAKVLVRLLAAAGGLAVTVGVWFVLAHRSHRSAAGQVSDVTSSQLPFHLHDFLAYLWQYYLPRLPGQGRYAFPPYFHGIPFYDVILRGLWGTFGWTEVQFPGPMQAVLVGITAILAVAALAALRRFRARIDWPVLAFLVLTGLALVGGLQWTDYQQLRESHQLHGFNQGRYLLPMVAVAGLGVATATRLVPRRWRGPLIAFFVVGLLLLNAYSFGLVAWRFYA